MLGLVFLVIGVFLVLGRRLKNKSGQPIVPESCLTDVVILVGLLAGIATIFPGVFPTVGQKEAVPTLDPVGVVSATDTAVGFPVGQKPISVNAVQLASASSPVLVLKTYLPEGYSLLTPNNCQLTNTNVRIEPQNEITTVLHIPINSPFPASLNRAYVKLDNSMSMSTAQREMNEYLVIGKWTTGPTWSRRQSIHNASLLGSELPQPTDASGLYTLHSVSIDSTSVNRQWIWNTNIPLKPTSRNDMTFLVPIHLKQVGIYSLQVIFEFKGVDGDVFLVRHPVTLQFGSALKQDDTETRVDVGLDTNYVFNQVDADGNGLTQIQLKPCS